MTISVSENISTRPGRFGLTVPDYWMRFDLSDGPLARARQAALKSARNPVDRMEVDDLFRQARALNNAARRHGALWGAGTVTVFDDSVFIGHVMVFAINPGEGDLTATTLGRQLSQAGAATDGGQAPERTVSVVRLPRVGDAVRIVGTEKVAVTAGAEVEMLTMHTLVAVPGGGSDYFLVTCCSPNLPLAEQVYELFDAITSTFHYLPA